MAENSKIEWTDATWNPIRARRKDTGKIGWHCERISPACGHCYAATFNKRAMPACGTGLDYTVPMREMVEVFVDENELLKPLKWKRGRNVFVCSMTDLFAGFVPFEAIVKVFSVMALAKQHTFQVLTKRAERMRHLVSGEFSSARNEYLAGEVALYTGRPGRFFPSSNLPWNATSSRWPLPNVWLGTTVEDQQRADERIPHLLRTPATVRFLSVEPMLGPIALAASGPFLDWVICGGESGHGARPSHPEWFRSLRDQCAATSTAFFFKQHGDWIDKDQLSPRAYGWNRTRVVAGKTYGVLTGGIGEAEKVLFDGKEFETQYPWRDDNYFPCMVRVGKHAAGRLLDAVEHSEFPR